MDIELHNYATAPLGTLIRLAFKLEKEGNLVEAANCLRCIVKREPKPSALMLLGGVLLELEKPEEAEECFLSANAFDPNLLFSIKSLGFIYFKRREYEKSKEYFIRSLEIEESPGTISVRL